MALGVQHVQDDALVVVMSGARETSTKGLDLLTSGVDIVDLDVEVNANLIVLRLGYPLESESG